MELMDLVNVKAASEKRKKSRIHFQIFNDYFS
jgi:hypothetical protein